MKIERGAFYFNSIGELNGPAMTGGPVGYNWTLRNSIDGNVFFYNDEGVIKVDNSNPEEFRKVFNLIQKANIT